MAYEDHDAAFLRQLGAEISRLRLSLGLSQEAFALRCGIHRTYLAGCERGLRNISSLNLRRIAEAGGVTLRDLFAFHRMPSRRAKRG